MRRLQLLRHHAPKGPCLVARRHGICSRCIIV